MRHARSTDPDTGERYLAVSVRGLDLLKSPLLNKGDAFTREERAAFGLNGLLPDRVATIDEQLARVHEQYLLKTGDLGRNIYLNGLMDRNETLFFRFLRENLADAIPVVYTPTVALACRHWSRIYRRARGIYVTPRDRGRMTEVLSTRSFASRAIIVVTDNERILGIGDQGAGGMGIPIGKLALYTVGAGLHPSRTVPISLDVGTENPELLTDPLYMGYREHRLRGDEYESFIAEFVHAVQQVFPAALLQWEDFSNRTSFNNLDTYRDTLPSFNDDIQGTAAMVVAGLMAATARSGIRIRDHRVVIVGAGSAGQGIRDLIVKAMVDDGASSGGASNQILSLDSRGLIVDRRPDLSAAKQRLAVGAEVVEGWRIEDRPIGLAEVVDKAKATVLIGVSGVPGAFTADVLERMARNTQRPIVMPLSNPTSHAEATPASVVEWTHGQAIVATGSPFPPVTLGGVTHRIGQANNMFIFPGVGLGALAVGARKITDRMLLSAAGALAAQVPRERSDHGQIYPDIRDVCEVSRAVAVAVARQAIAEGVADPGPDVEQIIDNWIWVPQYVPYRPA